MDGVGFVSEEEQRSNLFERLEAIRTEFDGAYTALDTAISNAELGSSRAAIKVAYAMRDRYLLDFYEQYQRALRDGNPANAPDRSLYSGLALADLDGPQLYDPDLLKLSSDSLRAKFLEEAKIDLDLNDR